MAANGDFSSLWDETRQLGQLFIMGFDGTQITDQVRILIENYHVGSILLTAKNLKSAAQTTQLVLELQTIAHNAGHPVPLLIAIDQENGGVNSLYDEVYIRQFPSAMGTAAAGSKKLAKDVARATAQELSSCGINWVLGPVLDVLMNAKTQPLGVRSFGDDPQEVCSYGIEYMKGYQEGGLATCGKHFPSYGNLEFFGAPTDVPTITDSLENLSQTALVPFRTAIAQGLDAMMVGGVAMASSGVNVMHACLSEEVVTNLLRHEMQFEGIVISECLEMEALSRNIGIGGGTVMAFKAGCDLLLTCRSLAVQEEAINGLRSGLESGMIERFRVQESVQRVLNMKTKYTSWDRAFAPMGIDNLARLQPLHSNLSSAIYNKSITVVRDQKRYLPLSKILRPDEDLLLLTPLVKPLPASAAYRHLQGQSPGQDPDHLLEFDTNASVRSGERVFRELGRSLARLRNGKLLHASYTANGVRPIHETLFNRAQAVVVVTADAGRNLYQNTFAKYISMMCKLAQGPNGMPKEKPCIVVAVSSPFDFVADTTISTYVCTYDFTETALQALVKVLYGELTASGNLPGSFGHKHQTNQARQQWLVENFAEERDTAALDNLIQQAQRDKTPSSSILKGATSTNFLLRNSGIDEAHFVVRNSSTKELFGFCATYYSKASQIGHIGAIIVDPARRKQSIGHSLHNRAIRALLQRNGVKRLQIGSRVPGVYHGIPKSDATEHKRLRQWFAKLGWNTSNSNAVSSLIIHDLSIWAAPEGLGQALTNPEVKYDLVHGPEYMDAAVEHLGRSSQTNVYDIYKLVHDNKEAAGAIRAKRAADGTTLGTLLLCRPNSKLTSFIPGFSKSGTKGCISSPVISPAAIDRNVLLQGLTLLGLRQLKRQGIRTAVFDCAREDSSLPHLYTLGFELAQSFEEITADPSNWNMMSPT